MRPNDVSGRRPIIGGNWKMNTTLPGAVDLATALVLALGDGPPAQIVLFPPFPNLHAVYLVLQGTALELGAQDVFWEQSGAYTGEVSAQMLESVGCTWILVGHSERRRILGESSEIVNRKLRAALHHGLGTILAVGESREERYAGRTEEVLATQLHQSLAEVDRDEMEHVVLAYEPVWAIGTGETATPEQAQQAHAYLRHQLADRYGDDIAVSTRIQYGGSVTPANAAELCRQPDVDGALVGGASLKADQFTDIVRALK